MYGAGMGSHRVVPDSQIMDLMSFLTVSGYESTNRRDLITVKRKENFL